MSVNTIFLDMDGVLTDFTKGAKKIEAIEGTKVDWPKIKKQGTNFWSELEWTPDGEKFARWLVKLCKESKIDLCILSAVAYEDGVKGKQIWLDEKLPTISKQNRYFVRGGRDKAKYASKNAVLIDDFGRNIEAFVMAGGQGVKFKNFEQAKEDLMSLI